MALAHGKTLPEMERFISVSNPIAILRSVEIKCLTWQPLSRVRPRELAFLDLGGSPERVGDAIKYMNKPFLSTQLPKIALGEGDFCFA